MMAMIRAEWPEEFNVKRADLKLVEHVEELTPTMEIPSRPAKTWARKLGQSTAVPDKKAG